MRHIHFLSSIGIAAAISLAAILQHTPPSQHGHAPAAQARQADRQHAPHDAAHANDPWKDIEHIVAVLNPTQGHEQISGVAHFEKMSDGRVRITVEVEGLQPGGVHAIHVHEFGDCTAPDATSAGSHYNPEGHDHALPESSDVRHAGDFGNLPPADERGRTHYELIVDNISLAGKKNPVLGRAVIVHAKPDTGHGDTGEAGARILCGVIGVANPDTEAPDQ